MKRLHLAGLAMVWLLAGCLEPSSLGSGDYTCGDGCAWDFVCDTQRDIPVCVVEAEAPMCAEECQVGVHSCRDGERVLCELDAVGCSHRVIVDPGCGEMELCLTDGVCERALFWAPPISVDGALNGVFVSGDGGFLAGDHLYTVENDVPTLLKSFGKPFRAIAGSGGLPTLMVAVGDEGMIYRDCLECEAMTVGTRDLLAVAFETARMGRYWAVGEAGAVVFCESDICQKVTDLPLPSPAPTLRGIWSDGEGGLVVVGDDGLVLQRRDDTWADRSAVVANTTSFHSVTGTSTTPLVFMGGDSQEAIFFDGVEAIPLPTPLGGDVIFRGAVASSKVDVWFVGFQAFTPERTSDFAAHFNGKTFRASKTGLTDSDLTAIHGTSRENVWRVGNDSNGQGFFQRTKRIGTQE